MTPPTFNGGDAPAVMESSLYLLSGEDHVSYTFCHGRITCFIFIVIEISRV